MRDRRLPFGIRLLVGFFAFGAGMCLLTALLLVWPGTFLDPLWRLNPEARVTFQALGLWAIVLMLVVASACAAAAAGLAQQRKWARWLAVGILGVNLAGDSANALLRHDLRTLIGLPIAAALIVYLIKWRSPR